jgi:serine protease AprX
MTPADDAAAPAAETRLEVPRALVEFILLGPEDDRRQLQDSPILGDVWIEFARLPGQRLELLITPHKQQTAGTVASVLSGDRSIAGGKVVDNTDANSGAGLGDANVAFLQGIVAASLTFEEVIRSVVPMTSWWADRRIEKDIQDYVGAPLRMIEDIESILTSARQWFAQGPHTVRGDLLMRERETRKRYIALAGLILWARHQVEEAAEPAQAGPRDRIRRLLDRVTAADIAATLQEVFSSLGAKPDEPLVWTVSLNRRASAAITKSVAAVKADAARTLFTVNCRDIVWAIIDSGIDATHRAFLDKAGESRVARTFDFTRIRDIVSLDNLRASVRRDARIKDLLKAGLKQPLSAVDAALSLQKLAQGARDGRSINWELVEPFVEVDVAENRPRSNHGTHVAGIIGASRDGADTAGADAAPRSADWADGMCPDIQLYDFRVLGGSIKETEFAIIAALQYIRYANERNSYFVIHGANLSLSIPHDVRNYACGQTPVCTECERLVNSGVVVVAAAGNHGYQNFQTNDGIYEGYAAFSVTDPGNADGVITVGATHRYSPHTYGVSFFSSRGPTGDGRVKPDLVAPGERIRAPVPGDDWGDLDGTSMAAPHVSGAAAMLMARYSELIGQPRRIKEILCRTATDLGREKTFQGHGMLDVLRAFQNV